jgi:hypothetical protein
MDGFLEDQLADAKEAFKNAHESGNKEAAQALAQRVFELETRVGELKKAEQESTTNQTGWKSPAAAAAVGATIGAVTNPIRGAVHDVITPSKPKAAPVSAGPAPDTFGGQDWTKALTGVDVPGAQMNKSSLDVGQRMAETVGRNGPLAGGTISPGGIMMGPELGAKTPVAPTPTTAQRTAQTGKNLLEGFVADHQPTRPMDIVKGGTRGALTGAALADVPQQVAQGNYGTAASDVGIASGNILHGLARTPKGKALGALLGLGSGTTRMYQGMNELMPPEQKAQGGLVGMAGGGSLTNALTQTAINAPFIAPTGAGIAKNVAKGAYAPAIEDAAGLALAMAPLNPLTAAMSMMAPGEAGAGSTADEWHARKSAEKAAMEKAQRQYEHEQFMRNKVGANAPKFLEQYQAKIRGFAPGGKVLKLWEKYGYDPAKIAQDYPQTLHPKLAFDDEKQKFFAQKVNSPEAEAVQKARKAAQAQINKGDYEPFFDINKRHYVDSSLYPLPDRTSELALPKTSKSMEKYIAESQNPAALQKWREGFEKGNQSPDAKDWYAMGQLHDEFVRELGPDEGIKQFKARFADPMGATTGGSNPTSNLMTAAYANFMKQKGLTVPENTFEVPFPIGGRYLDSNLAQARKLHQAGTLTVDTPKRYNFSADFLGHKDRPTLDEQMMSSYGKTAPEDIAYGLYEKELNKLAKEYGVDPINFQDVTWAGLKDYPGKAMMQEINEMLARTSKITGDSQKDVLKGFIRADKPMYSVAGLGGLTQLPENEE